MQMIEANWVAFVVAILAVLLIGWLIFRSATKPKARVHRPDVLDEGIAPAQRNQALIDAPAAVAPAAAANAAAANAAVANAAVANAGVANAGVANAAASFAATGPDVMMGMGEVAAAAVVEEVRAVEEARAAPPSPTEADDLRRIKGVGPKLVALLHGLGVTRYSQVAAWTAQDIARIDSQLGTFAGRIERDSWVEQAKFLAAGDKAGFEGKFGKL